MVIICLLVHVACSNGNGAEYENVLADSLCNSIEAGRYVDIEDVYRSALMLDSIAEDGAEYNFIAKNALAYVALMNMDYSGAEGLYKHVAEDARCEVERLIADVGLMMLYYRTSANRDFFDYRSEALQRIARINEEAGSLPHDEWVRFSRALVEFDIVSVCYFANIGIENELLSSVDRLKRSIDRIDDIPLRIYARMMLNIQSSQSLSEQFDVLTYGLRRAQSLGLRWLSGNYRLLLAIMLRDDVMRSKLVETSAGRITELGGDSINLDILPLHIAMQAVDDFNEYGDGFMTVEAQSVVASCYTQIARYTEALSVLEDALSVVNGYYLANGMASDSFPPFSIYDVDEAMEMDYMENDSMKNIAECLLSVRREAACAHAGLGDKYASDINRNSYLDLLRTTRLNKRMERSAEIAAESAGRMYMWSLVAVMTLVTVFITMYILNRRWSVRNKSYTDDMKALLALCRQLMSSLPQEFSDEKEVYDAVEEILNSGLHSFSGRTVFKIDKSGKGLLCGSAFLYVFPLEQMDGCNNDVLYLGCEKELSAERHSLIELMLPYISVTLDEGRRIVRLADEQQQLEELRESYNSYLAGHKRENILKRVSVAVVAGMKPYMDRMLNELKHLYEAGEFGKLERLRLEYVAELSDKLDDYTVILERWIKMRRGDLNLNIENFSVADVFDIIAKRAPSFEYKGLLLEVRNCFSVVKADKALTLFMINTLTDNAGKFTPSGGRIIVEALDGDGFVEIAVSDTGIGLSKQEINTILNEKVYDASMIGCDIASSASKGGGFGLMNCKGIIDKYRKTDAVFDVCRMNIESCRGRGSRFSFRLPKGVIRATIIVLAMLFSSVSYAADEYFEQINALVDSVYNCNVNGRYESSLQHAKSVIGCFNDYYKEVIGGDDTLSFSSSYYSELYWWRNELFPDSLTEDIFYNLLDVRNEIAVAALAINDWNTYRYNNGIYSQLYRLVHEDKEITLYYENMRRLANYRQVAVVICITFIIVLLLVYASLYLRRGLIERMNAQLVLDVNKRLLRSASAERMTVSEFAWNIADEIYTGLRELLRINSVVVLLKGDEKDGFAIAASPVKEENENIIYLKRAFESGEGAVYAKGLFRVSPLVVIVAGKRIVLGSIGVSMERSLTENEQMSVELITDYAASAAYHFAVRLAGSYRSLDEVQEETERVRMEEGRLHVQNMVMDNCLSTLKHETLYYPGRIKELVDEVLRDDMLSSDVWHDKITAMKELMDYYNSIFAVLSSCAMRQLDDSSFRISKVPMSDVWAHVTKFIGRRTAKASVSIELVCDSTEAVACGDPDLIYFLFESLVTAALTEKSDGRLHLSVVEEEQAIRVHLLDERRHITAEQAAELFTPSRGKITASGIKDMEYLVAKEIVRMHEDNMGRRGARMEARDGEKGLSIFFTLPK